MARISWVGVSPPALTSPISGKEQPPVVADHEVAGQILGAEHIDVELIARAQLIGGLARAGGGAAASRHWTRSRLTQRQRVRPVRIKL